MEQHFVRPYRGPGYGIEKPYGVKILVVGESSYYDETNVDGPLPEDWVQRIIGDVYNNKSDISITRAACVFSGRLEPFSWRQDFWRTAAFTNFVQNSAGAAPRDRPSAENWLHGANMFGRVLNELAPEFVLVLGKQLWARAFEPSESSDEVVQGNWTKPYCILKHASGGAFAFGINHPASCGWTYANWSPWVAAALDKARQGLLGDTPDGEGHDRSASAPLTALIPSQPSA